jgi:hypothetical protein
MPAACWPAGWLIAVSDPVLAAPPAATARAMMATFAVPLAAIVPSEQCTVWPSTHDPSVDATDTGVTVAGSGSVSATRRALAPWSRTVNVKEIVDPGWTACGPPVAISPSLAAGAAASTPLAEKTLPATQMASTTRNEARYLMPQ